MKNILEKLGVSHQTVNCYVSTKKLGELLEEQMKKDTELKLTYSKDFFLVRDDDFDDEMYLDFQITNEKDYNALLDNYNIEECGETLDGLLSTIFNTLLYNVNAYYEDDDTILLVFNYEFFIENYQEESVCISPNTKTLESLFR